jgi:hypothetical protein
VGELAAGVYHMGAWTGMTPDPAVTTTTPLTYATPAWAGIVARPQHQGRAAAWGVGSGKAWVVVCGVYGVRCLLSVCCLLWVVARQNFYHF